MRNKRPKYVDITINPETVTASPVTNGEEAQARRDITILADERSIQDMIPDIDPDKWMEEA